ncbi:uncharacterized protein LOC144457042 isoform X2 [Phascolarctos cinereus]
MGRTGRSSWGEFGEPDPCRAGAMLLRKMKLILGLLLSMAWPMLHANITLTGKQRLSNRYLLISKQCHKFCPFLEYYYQKFSHEKEGPNAFVYSHCCAENLCNVGIPSISESDTDIYSQYTVQGIAHLRASNMGLVIFLSFLPVLLQVRKTLCLL